jgi:hypothetical protein
MICGAPPTYYIWAPFNPTWELIYANDTFDDWYNFNDITNAWSNKGAHESIYGAASFQLGNYGFMIGGNSGSIVDLNYDGQAGGIHNNNRQLDLLLETWSSRMSLPDDRYKGSGFNLGNQKGYVWSGFSRSTIYGGYEIVFGHPDLDNTCCELPYAPIEAEQVSLYNHQGLHEYDFTLNSWTRKSNSEMQPVNDYGNISDHPAGSGGNTGYALQQQLPNHSGWDQATDTWSFKTNSNRAFYFGETTN